MSDRKIYPPMSNSRRVVLCQGKNFAAAYPCTLMGETLWCCELIEGHPGETRGRSCVQDCQAESPGDAPVRSLCDPPRKPRPPGTEPGRLK